MRELGRRTTTYPPFGFSRISVTLVSKEGISGVYQANIGKARCQSRLLLSPDDRTNLGTGSLQRATFRPRNHHPMHQVVPNVQAQLPRPRPDDGRAGYYVSSYDHLRWVQRYVPDFAGSTPKFCGLAPLTVLQEILSVLTSRGWFLNHLVDCSIRAGLSA